MGLSKSAGTVISERILDIMSLLLLSLFGLIILGDLWYYTIALFLIIGIVFFTIICDKPIN